MRDLPTYADVVAAAGRLQGYAHATPVLRSSTLDQQLGAQELRIVVDGLDVFVLPVQVQ